jgi:hypothetical protein
MVTLKNSTVSRFHNLTDEALADAIGRADAIVKGAQAELATLKDEFKARGLSEVAGDEFAVRPTTRATAWRKVAGNKGAAGVDGQSVERTEQISGRIDTKAVKDLLGARYSAFKKAIIS